jgi:hypothetical protein
LVVRDRDCPVAALISLFGGDYADVAANLKNSELDLIQPLQAVLFAGSVQNIFHCDPRPLHRAVIRRAKADQHCR